MSHQSHISPTLPPRPAIAPILRSSSPNSATPTSPRDVPELPRQAEQLYLGESGLEELVVGVHGLIGAVVVGGDPAQLGGLEVPTLPVVLPQLALLELHGSRLNEVGLPLLQPDE